MIPPAQALLIAAAMAGLAAMAFWPERGWCWRWARYRRLTRRVLMEDALKHLYHCEYDGLPPTLDSLSGALQIPRNRAADLASRLETAGLLRTAESGPQLTTEGRRYALRVIRGHRLLEKYLADRTGMAESRWHEEADRREHLMSPDDIDALALEMGNPRYDPHGDPIPTATGDIAPPSGRPLPALPVGQLARVTHVEDEPEVVYKQLVAQGLTVGVRVRILEITPERIRIEAEGEEQVLAPVVAANLSVVEMSAAQKPPEFAHRLADLNVGEKAEVVGFSPVCRGIQRRRLFDLGLVPGTVVEAQLQGPGGDPTAYVIRGALIAIRKDQANLIHVENRV